MRVFISFPVSEKVKRTIKNAQQKIEKHNMEPTIKWQNPEKMHVTVKFIGEVEKGDIEELKKIMQKSVKGIESFEYALNNLDAFPDLNQPRILISKLSEKRIEAFMLERNLSGYLKKYGFEIDKKKWVPHITLGRVKEGSKNLEIPNIDFPDLSWEVDRLDLVESKLTQEGSEYTKLFSVSL